MIIKFIGTSSGKTDLHRFHSSLLVISPNENLLIDCGDGISKAILSAGKSSEDINNIIITHLHPDHFTGLASLLIQMKMSDRKSLLKIFVHKNHKENIKQFLKIALIFEERLKFPLEIISVDTDDLIPFENFSVKIIRNHHVTPERYNKLHDDSLISFSLMIEASKNIFYSSDLGSNEDIALFENLVMDIAIFESSHIDIDQLIKFSVNRNIEKLYLTHIDDADKLKNEISNYDKMYQQNIVIAVDQEEIRI